MTSRLVCRCGWHVDVDVSSVLHFMPSEDLPCCPRVRWWNGWRHQVRTELRYEAGELAEMHPGLTAAWAHGHLARMHPCGCQEFWFMDPPGGLRCERHQQYGPIDAARPPEYLLVARDVLAAHDRRRMEENRETTP